MPVVVQRQAQMVQTVLGGSAVTVHPQGYQHLCHSGSNAAKDSTVHAMQRTSSASTGALHFKWHETFFVEVGGWVEGREGGE